MKKSIMMLMAISLVFALVAPAMAETAVEFSGRYFVRGTWMDNGYFTDDSGAPNSGQTLDDHAMTWYDQELRMNVTFKPNENVSVFWRFDVADYTWGTENYYAGIANVDDFDLDRMWASIKTPYGVLDVGRMAGGQWGLDWGNYGTNGSDRIKFTTAIGDLALGAIIEKRIEADSNTALNAIDDDADFDVYHLFGVYKQETFETGLLLTYARDRRNQGANTTVYVPGFITAPTATVGQNAKVSETDYYNFNLYGIFNFGPFTLQGEVQHEWGDIDWYAIGAAGTDIDTWMWNIEGQYAAGPFSIALGIGWVEGQDEKDWAGIAAGTGGGEATAANAANGGIGNDFAPLFVMTDVDAALNSHNWVAGRNVAAQLGVEMIYMTASYAATETLSFGLNAGYARTEEDWHGGPAGVANYDDDYGWEVDLTMSWDAMDNVNYALAFAYVDTGDAYAQAHNNVPSGAAGSDGDDVWAMRHTLTINF